MGTNKAVRVEKFTTVDEGLPGIKIVEEDIPKPGQGEVLVRLTLRPVNPTDEHSIAGKRPIGPHEVPFTAGTEGVGKVAANGPGASKYSEGQRVVAIPWPVLEGRGTWQQYVTVKKDVLVPVPDGISEEDASQYLINPFTAVGLVDSLEIPKGEYLLQTAAGSVLGKMVIKYAKSLGIKTINVVRREEQREELTAIGADEVINSKSEDLVARVKEITGGKGAYGSIECVGGSTTRQVGLATRTGGTINVYGALSGDDATFHLLDTLYNNKTIKGWLLFVWIGTVEPQALRQRVWQLMQEGILKPESGQAYPLEKAAEALKASVQPARKGKLFLEG